MPSLYLTYINHTDGQQQVDVGVELAGKSWGVHQCTSPDVLAAADALKDACRQELSSVGKAGAELGLTMEKRPSPTEVAATPVIPT